MTPLIKTPAAILIAGAIAILCGVIGLTSWRLMDTRDMAISNAYQVSENLASTIEVEIRRDLETYALSLQAVADGLKMPELDTVSPKLRDAVLFDSSSHAPQYGSILVLDEHGKLKLSSTARIALGYDFSDKDFFAVHRDDPDLGLKLTAPYRQTLDGDSLIVLSRRLNHPDGSFAGIVAGALRLKYVEQLFHGIKVDDGTGITLLMTDGTIIARSPHRDSDIGRNIRNAPVLQHFVRARAGEFEAATADSTAPRLYVYKQIGDMPLLITVSVLREMVLIDWWHKAFVICALVACFVIVVAAIGYMLYRELMRRARAEQRARENEERYRLLADNSSDLIVLSRDGETIYVSPAVRRLYGYEPEELIGTKIEDRVHPDDLPALAAAEQQVIASGEALVTYRCRNKKGEMIWVEASWRRSVAPYSRSTEFVVVARDITQRVRNEEAMRAAKEHADAANRAKSSFLAHMSHEIRTPMNGILGMNHLLLATDLDPEQREYAATIGDSASSLLRIIDDILDESKLEAGKVEIEFADFDLDKTLDDVISILRPRAAQKDVRLGMAVHPSACGWFRGDAVRLRQVLLNIAGNAVKFTDRGHIAIDVSMPRALGDHAVLRFEVADTGVGIDAEAQARLFQKFTQADVSISRRFGGTGLGLAIAKQLVELMGGTIGFSSVAGEGSLFCFEIPLERTVPPAAASEAPKPAPPAAAPQRALHVLIAEDNKVNQHVAELIVAHAGHRVDLADNGRQAVEAARARDYDVILMDLQMPELDGFAAAREIRRLPGRAGQVPIVALTSHAMAGTREEVIAAGMDDYISKPFDANQLLAKLQHLAAFRSAGEEHIAPIAHERQESKGDARFDRDKLDQLSAATGAAFASLLTSLIQAIEQRVALILRLIDNGEFAQAGREAHDLVGIAGNVGGMRLSALSRQMQHACQGGDAAKCRAIAAELRAEAEALSPLMHEYHAAMAA